MRKEKITDYRLSYAQNREDIILAAFFEGIERGFYVDIGANDPVVESVTKYFYDRGWRGINCEPQLPHFIRLQKERKRDTNLNIGVGSKEGNLKLRQYIGDGLSTFSEDFKREYAKKPNSFTNTYKDVTVSVRKLKNIFKENNVKTINFMKVDVEGYEYEVLDSNDWSLYRPEVICIESDHIRRDWHGILKDKGYKLVFNDGLNEYFTDANIPEIEKRFSYVNSILLGKPVVSNSLASMISELDEQNEQNKKVIIRLNQDIEKLVLSLDEISSLRKHIKHTIRHIISKLSSYWRK